MTIKTTLISCKNNCRRYKQIVYLGFDNNAVVGMFLIRRVP
jgi:hypothetical protein